MQQKQGENVWYCKKLKESTQAEILFAHSIIMLTAHATNWVIYFYQIVKVWHYLRHAFL